MAHGNVNTRQASADVALELAVRADNAEEIDPKEYRRLFIKGLAALLREVDSIAYRLKQIEQRR